MDNTLTVIPLTSADFKNSSIEIKNLQCGLVLFHDASNAATRIRAVYQASSETVVGVNFWTVDLTTHRDIAKLFANLGQTDPAYRWAQTTYVNFILVYRQGQPQTKYTGSLTVAKLTQFALDNVCYSNPPDTPSMVLTDLPKPTERIKEPTKPLNLPPLADLSLTL